MTEWGVHWNFYATIYVVNLVLVLIQDWLEYSLPFAVTIMLGYEFSILALGLKNYVFYGPRNGFLSANREGVVSSFGYLAISLIGIEFGHNIFKSLYDKQHGQSKEVGPSNENKEVKLFFKMIV